VRVRVRLFVLRRLPSYVTLIVHDSLYAVWRRKTAGQPPMSVKKGATVWHSCPQFRQVLADFLKTLSP